MSRAQINQNLFNQAAQIYGQMGMGVPGFGGRPGKGRFTAHLQNVIAQGQNMLNQYRMRQMQQQMQQAMQAQRSQAAPAQAQTKTLVSTLKAANAGPRGARSKTQKRAQQSGVRNTNVLQASGYLGGTGDSTLQAKPIGASINMA